MPLDSPTLSPTAATSPSRPFLRFGVFLAALCLCFCIPLSTLVRYATHSELYSHVLLIPFITLYLIWLNRSGVVSTLRPPSSVLSPQSSVFALAGLALLGWYSFLRWRGWQPARADYLAFTIFPFLCFLISGGLVFLGHNFMKALAFPIGLLFFIVPFPVILKEGIEQFFQHASADAASILFSVSDTPLFREGLIFHLPGMNIRVAEECSGIRSSLVLFITGLLAAYLFLRSPWKRGLLALVVIPLGIARNGFRIFTIGMLCVHVDPGMINSPIHRRGGPIFFLLSLVPFFLILLWLRRSEQRRPLAAPPGDVSKT